MTETPRQPLRPKLMSFDVFGTLISVRDSSYGAFERILAAAGADRIDVRAFWEHWEHQNINSTIGVARIKPIATSAGARSPKPLRISASATTAQLDRLLFRRLSGFLSLRDGRRPHPSTSSRAAISSRWFPTSTMTCWRDAAAAPFRSRLHGTARARLQAGWDAVSLS